MACNNKLKHAELSFKHTEISQKKAWNTEAAHTEA